jgi:hypothetical protein
MKLVDNSDNDWLNQACRIAYVFYDFAKLPSPCLRLTRILSM